MEIQNNTIVSYTVPITENYTKVSYNFPVWDDECDCDKRCDKCGKRKGRGLNPPWIITC